MIYHLKAVLTQDELTELRAIAARVRWDDGRKTGPDRRPLKQFDPDVGDALTG